MLTGSLRKTLPFLAVGMALGSCGSPGPARSVVPARSSTATATSPPAMLATTTTAVPASVATRDAAQLRIQYTGSQGATGFWADGFWIADRSQTPCAIRSSVTLDLADRFGIERSASAPLWAPIALSAGAGSLRRPERTRPQENSWGPSPWPGQRCLMPLMS